MFEMSQLVGWVIASLFTITMALVGMAYRSIVGTLREMKEDIRSIRKVIEKVPVHEVRLDHIERNVDTLFGKLNGQKTGS